MALRVQKVTVFDKGLITEINAESLPPGSASNQENVLDLGDRIQISPGRKAVGDLAIGTGKTYAIVSATAIDGTTVTFKKTRTKIQHLDPLTDTWVDALTGLPDEQITFAAYRTPAGSFVFASSPNSGLYRVNLANPLSWIDLFDELINFKGFIKIQDNRMWMWQVTQEETVANLSYIDNDFPYASVSAEVIDVGNGSDVTFTGTLANTLVAGRTLSITDTVEVFIDSDGMGNLVGDQGGTGVINYTTGAYSITFNTAPVNLQNITADYSFEDPNDEGITDFTFDSPARLAGQGDFFFQAQNSKKIQNVLSYDEKFYVPHEDNYWIVDLTADDTGATNKIFRENLGIPSIRGAVATGKGIFFIDNTSNTGKQFRLLKYNETSARVIPKSISDQLNIDAFDFSDCAVFEYGDFVLWSFKAKDGDTNNSKTLVYNQKWNLWDIIDGGYDDFTNADGKLYGASSVSDNVFQLFTGFDNDGSPYNSSWTSNDDNLETEELKKVKYVFVEGDIVPAQELIFEAAYDSGEFVEMGRVGGTSQFVISETEEVYGVQIYGVGLYGSSEPINAGKYQRRFKITNPKFYRAKWRVRSEKAGFYNVRIYRWDDIRKKRLRIAAKFRG